jgi:3-hydroxyisobutyrate dehydrogenase-like beta-hydroxyacid dehydrogenase
VGTVAPTEAIAILGMGNMGRALAQRMLDQGYETSIWNRSVRDLSALEARGARVLSSLQEAWGSDRTALTFVADDGALSDICLGTTGLLRTAPPGSTLIDLSTVSPSVSRVIAEGAKSARVDYLRAPVSGNPLVLAAGNLTIIVSGPEATFRASRSLLESVGPKVLYVGREEEARMIKLAINAGLAVTTELLAELILLVESHGLDRSVLLEVLGDSVLGSPFVKYKTANLISRDYAATFTTELLAKDLRLALALADERGLTLPAVQLISTLTEEATRGYREADFAALLPHLQRAHGVEPDVPAQP